MKIAPVWDMWFDDYPLSLWASTYYNSIKNDETIKYYIVLNVDDTE